MTTMWVTEMEDNIKMAVRVGDEWKCFSIASDLGIKKRQSSGSANEISYFLTLLETSHAVKLCINQAVAVLHTRFRTTHNPYIRYFPRYICIRRILNVH
jgi:hypothetical protein